MTHQRTVNRIRCPKCVTHPVLRPSGKLNPDLVCPVCSKEYSTNPKMIRNVEKTLQDNNAENANAWWKVRTYKRKRSA